MLLAIRKWQLATGYSQLANELDEINLSASVS